MDGGTGVRQATAALLCRTSNRKGASDMLWTISILLLALWAMGWLTSYTMGGHIHILLPIALVVMLVRVIQGRRAPEGSTPGTGN